jgi:hypothetical protein
MSANPTSARSWPIREALALSCAIFRQTGYTNSSIYLAAAQTDVQRFTNKDMLSYALVPQLASHNYLMQFQSTEVDIEQADMIIKYFRRLTFGIIADDLSEYMSKVYNVTQHDHVIFSDIGIMASIPLVYDNAQTAKALKAEVNETVNEHIGKEGEYVTVTIRYIKTRYIPSLNCFAHDAITDTNYLVNFLSKIKLGDAGVTHKIKAKVKKHGINYHTKTAETQLNYVKVLDSEFIWQ